jgi:hypothetical protein
MNADRKSAIVVGVLFIIGTVAGVLSVVLTGSLFAAPETLAAVAAQRNQVVLAALFVLTMGFALAMVPVVFYPVASRHNRVLALGYLVFRGALETVTYIALVIDWLLLVVLSQEFVKAGAAEAPYLRTLGALLLQGANGISNLVVLTFGAGALLFYALLYQSRLVPRWVSVWGLIAIVLHLATGFLQLFAVLDADSTIISVMNAPIFLQEMVMAVWLIAKGFEPAALAAGSARAAAEGGGAR